MFLLCKVTKEKISLTVFWFLKELKFYDKTKMIKESKIGDGGSNL
jgi:hypothetical protein